MAWGKEWQKRAGQWLRGKCDCQIVGKQSKNVLLNTENWLVCENWIGIYGLLINLKGEKVAKMMAYRIIMQYCY